ncbi:uncharacterized protein METZ01_LOCUS514672, partial [marine metagenome]
RSCVKNGRQGLKTIAGILSRVQCAFSQEKGNADRLAGKGVAVARDKYPGRKPVLAS